MNQSIFKPRILLLAMALTAGAAGVQANDTTPSATTTPETPSRMSYAPCANLQGTALSDCLTQNANTSSSRTSSATGADANASAGASSPNTSINSNTSVGASTSSPSSTYS